MAHIAKKYTTQQEVAARRINSISRKLILHSFCFISKSVNSSSKAEWELQAWNAKRREQRDDPSGWTEQGTIQPNFLKPGTQNIP